MKIVWLPMAIANRNALIDAIAQNNPQAALDQDECIEDQIDLLANNPKMGREGHKKNTRELVISKTKFVAVYRVRQGLKRIEILRILHTSQKWP